MRRINVNTEWNTINWGTPEEWRTAAAPAHWAYRNWGSRTPIIDTTYVSPAMEFPLITNPEYYDIGRGGTIVQIGDRRYLFTHDVGRYFSMDWDIYADVMIYRRLEDFAPDPIGIVHHWTPTPDNPFLIYEKRYEAVWDKERAEHILKCYSDPGAFKMGDYIILSEKQYAELKELNAILPRYKYMINDAMVKRANDVDELIAAIKKKSKKEMGYFV